MSKNAFGDYVDTFQKGWNLGLDLGERKKIIAERLRIIRIKSGFKQKDIAEKIKLNPRTYSGYENEIGLPPIEALIRIADFYQVSLDYITGRSDYIYGIKQPDENKTEQQPTNDDLITRIEKLEKLIPKSARE